MSSNYREMVEEIYEAIDNGTLEIVGYANEAYQISEQSVTFIEDMYEKFEQYGSKTRLSDKQKEWIESLHNTM